MSDLSVLRISHFVVIEHRGRKETLHDWKGGQAFATHGNDHIHNQVEAEEKVGDADDDNAGNEVPGGDVESDDVLEHEIDVDADDEDGERQGKYF